MTPDMKELVIKDSYITDCHLEGRVGDVDPFKRDGNIVTVRMDRYKIMPLEKFEELTKELEQAKKDAGRYRYIYDKACQTGVSDTTIVLLVMNQSKLDDRIADAAIAKESA